DVGGGGERGDRGGTSAIYGDAHALVQPAATQVGGIDEGGAIGRELRHKGVKGAAECRLQGTDRGEVGGEGVPGDVGGASAIHGDGTAFIEAAAAQVGGIDEGGAIGRELRHKGVKEAAECRLQGMDRGEVAGVGEPGDVGGASAIHGDGIAPLVPAATQVGGIDEGGAIGR